MKCRYSKVRNSTLINIFGFDVVIEYRVRLKTFDLIFYPNKGKTYGNSQFYDKFQCRHNDFTALMACIIKASEDYATMTECLPFYALVKVRCAELLAIEAAAAAEIPCA